MNKISSSESGNVLFLILIAVALFAALSYAVTQSTRSGGGDASKEKNLVDASAIVQTSAAIRQAVLRMIVSQGIAPETLLFDPPNVFSTLSADEITREAFHPSGGGASYREGWIVTSSFEVEGMGLTNIGDPLQSSDIVAVHEVSKDICLEINRKLGLSRDIESDAINGTGPSIDIESNNLIDNMDKTRPGINGGGNGFWGTVGSSGNALLASYDGKSQGCFYNGSSSLFIYYDVIVAR